MLGYNSPNMVMKTLTKCAIKNKWLLIFLLGLGLFFIETAVCSAEPAYNYLKHVRLIIGEKAAEVNYQPKTMVQPAYKKDGCIMVPLRFVGESLGAGIVWDSASQQAKLTWGENNVAVVVVSKEAYVNGELTTRDLPIEVIKGSVFVPIRFISESLEANVIYDAGKQTITMDYIDTSYWASYTAPGTKIKYLYPDDWTVTTEDDDTVVVFKSPNETELSCYLEAAPEEFYETIKQVAQEKGWELQIRDNLVKGDPHQGYKIQLSTYDQKAETHIWEVFFVRPYGNGRSLVGEVYPKNGLDNNPDPAVAYMIWNSFNKSGLANN